MERNNTKLISKFDECGDVLFDKRFENHRPEALTPTQKDLICDALHNDPQTTLLQLQAQIQSTFHERLSLTAIHNYEMKIGYFGYPRVIPILSQRNKAKRVAFAKNHREDHFSNVFFFAMKIQLLLAAKEINLYLQWRRFP